MRFVIRSLFSLSYYIASVLIKNLISDQEQMLLKKGSFSFGFLLFSISKDSY